MNKASRMAAVLVGAVLAGAIAACGTGPGGPPTSGCTDQTRGAGAPGDAEPLLVLGAAAFSPTIVYADGAVVIPAAEVAAGTAAGYLHLPMMLPGYHGDQPGGFAAGWLSECELDAVIARADALFTDGVDFGDPMVTDAGNTLVSYDGHPESVYAFSRDEPTEWSDLSSPQKQARQDLADLWTLVEDSTTVTGEVEARRLFVHVFDAIDDSEVTAWPLDVPVSVMSRSACTTVSDPTQVDLMLERLRSGEPLLEDSDWRLAVVAVAPGVPDC